MSSYKSSDLTIVACGTSLTWATGNEYANKFPNLVHRDLTAGYPLEEKYLHFNRGSTPGGGSDPTPSYYDETTNDGYGSGHPKGDPLPPKQYRARGGAIIGLTKPAPVKFGGKSMSDIPHNDAGDYFTRHESGEYYGKLDDRRYYDDKFSTTDVNKSLWVIGRDIGWSWPTIPNQLKQFPRNGSFIGRRKVVDVPNGNFPTFGGQADGTPPDGEDVDLAIIDGGTNDLTLGWLNNPTKSGRRQIWQAAREYSYRDMTGSDGLLQRTRDRFPNAVIVLIGYPLWASNRTDNKRARKFLIHKKSVATFLPGAAEQAIDNVLNFQRYGTYWLRRAVTEENERDTGPGILFAPPGYSVANGMMADWPWSFGYEPNGGDVGYTTDDTRDKREVICGEEQWWEQIISGNEEEVNLSSCRMAPIGHPNPEGCRQYADTIVRRYKEYIDKSVRGFADGLHPDSDSLRDSLQRYGFDPTNSVRYATTHDVVDSIHVRTFTNSGGGMGRRRGEIYLNVYPGRSGSGERFRLDSEHNDNRPGGPKSRTFRPHVRPKDEYYIEPMLTRDIEGPAGNTDNYEVGTSKQYEPNKQTYHKQGHWSDERLTMGEVKYLTLELEGVDPAAGWNLDRVAVSLNGDVIERTRSFANFDNKDLRVADKNTSPFDRREFLLATFNDVDGLFGSEIDLSISEQRSSISLDSNSASVDVVVDVTNTGSVAVPTVGLQCGMRVKNVGGRYTGRDWAVEPTGALDPGATETMQVTLQTNNAGHIRTNNKIALLAVAEVAGSFTSTSKVTRKKGLK
jgi:hypothetical protein